MCILRVVSAWLLSLALAPAVAPEPGPMQVDPNFVWEAPGEVCPDQDRVNHKLAEGGAGAGAGVQSGITARGSVKQDGDAYVLSLEMQAGSAVSHRKIRSDSCESLLDAALFSYTLAVEREAEAKAEAPPKDLKEEPEAPPEIEDPLGLDGLEEAAGEETRSSDWEEARLTKPERQAERPVDVAFRAHAGIGQGPLGLGSAPIGASFAVGMNRWRMEVGGVWYVPRSVTLTNPDDAGARLTAWGLRGRGCGVLAPSTRWIVPLCGQLDGGLTRGSGFGVNAPLTPTSPHLSLGAAVATAYSATRRIRLWLEVQGGVALARSGFFVEGSDEALFRAPAGGFGAEFGIEIRFGSV